MKLWPFCIRLAVEFDAIDVQQLWWLPWFHSWRFGFRVGVLGLHLIVGISFLHDDLDRWAEQREAAGSAESPE